MKKNKVAFDTNVFIYLSFLDAKIFRKFFKKNLLLKKTLLIYHGIIRDRFLKPVILPMVKEEIHKYERKKNDKIYNKLIEMGCVYEGSFSNIDLNKSLELAEKYSEHVVLDEEYQVFEETQEKKAIYPYYKKKVLANDAIIMAQATVKNLPVVSYDDHFIKHLNPLYIRQVNMDNGYSPECFPYRPDEYLMKFTLQNDNFIAKDINKNTVKEKERIK